MSKILNKFFSIIVCLFLLFSYSNVSAYTAHTSDEAINWAKSKVGVGIDYDGGAGNQCVDLVFAYYDYLGVPVVYSDGKDFATNKLPDGWVRIKDGKPEKGDVLIYTNEPYGHVAIYESDSSSFHQNFNGHNYVDQVSYKYNLFSDYWGVIRPDFKKENTDSTIFKDVKKANWFYNDVMYVYDNNIIRGYGNGNYGPYDNLTRYMFVVILHRLENEPVVSRKSNFSDVSNNTWYKKAVDWAVQNKIVYGYGDNTFKPNKNITREEFITMLYRYAKYKGVDMSANTDITSYSDYNQIGTYAREAVKWSVSKKIVYGSNNKIKPKDNITRAETAAIIHRYMNKFN